MPQIMMRYKKREVGDFQTLLNQYPEAELHSPVCSSGPRWVMNRSHQPAA